MAEARGGSSAQAGRIAGLDTSVAHPARVYDYWLGGKDNFAADREAAERVLAVAPGLRYRVRANRAFLGRATRYLAAEAGVRQFLDIGTGIPTGDNTHEVAQRAAGLDPHVATRIGFPVTAGAIDGRAAVTVGGVPYHLLLPWIMPGRMDRLYRAHLRRAALVENGRQSRRWAIHALPPVKLATIVVRRLSPLSPLKARPKRSCQRSFSTKRSLYAATVLIWDEAQTLRAGTRIRRRRFFRNSTSGRRPAAMASD